MQLICKIVLKDRFVSVVTYSTMVQRDEKIAGPPFRIAGTGTITTKTGLHTMLTQSLRLMLLALLMLGLAACKDTITVASPAANSVHQTLPEFKLTYKTKPSKIPKVVLNGAPVDTKFTWNATEAVATGASMVDAIREGKNLFQVDPPLGPQVSFIYDTKGPEVVILSASGTGPVEVKGMAIDAMGVKSFKVNDQTVSVASNGSFTASVSKADTYRFDAVDTLDHASTTKHASMDLLYTPSLKLKLNQNGMDLATNRIINLLNGLDLNKIVGGATLYDSTWKGAFGETYGADGFLQSVSVSASAFKLDLKPGGNGDFTGTISNAHASLMLRLHNGLLPPTVINIGAAVGPLDFAGNLNASVMSHKPVITLSNFSFRVGNVVLDSTPALFNAILSPIISGIVNLFNGPISGAIEKALSNALPQLFDELIQKSYTIRLLDGNGNNMDMAMALQLEAITTTDDTLQVDLSGGVTPSTPNPLVKQPLGPVYTDDALPDPAMGTNQLGLAINTNVINQTLAAAHSVGLTHINMMGDKVYLGLPRNDSLGIEDDMRILVDTDMPPYFKMGKKGDLTKTTFGIRGLKIVSQAKKGGLWKTQFTTKVNVEADINLSVTADNKLGIIFLSAPKAVVTSLSILDGPELSNLFNETVNRAIDLAIGPILENLAKPITQISLPSFACMAIDAPSFTAVGATSSQTNVAASLKIISNACDVAPVDPPKVAYGRGVGTPMTCASNEEYDAGLCYDFCRTNYTGVGPVCWRDNASYGRGVGTVASLACGSGQEMDAGLCYPVCRSGYHGVGPVCWSDQELSYGRGVGTIPNLIPYECRGGKEMDAGLCYWPCKAGYKGVGPVCWLIEASYGRGVGTVPGLVCSGGKELDAGLCYTPCSSGYHGIGPVCWTNDELSYGRGVGRPIHTCPDGKELDAGLCYKQCEPGYNGIGPVCWPE